MSQIKLQSRNQIQVVMTRKQLNHLIIHNEVIPPRVNYNTQHHKTKLNKVAVENQWNPYEIEEETSSNTVKSHVTNQVAVKKPNLKQNNIII